MLVRQFKFKRNNDKGSFQWTAESEIERPGFYRGFTAVGKTLADVKEFAALVRWCERTGSLERLLEMHPPSFEGRMQTTWAATGIRTKGKHDDGGYDWKPPPVAGDVRFTWRVRSDSEPSVRRVEHLAQGSPS